MKKKLLRRGILSLLLVAVAMSFIAPSSPLRVAQATDEPEGDPTILLDNVALSLPPGATMIFPESLESRYSIQPRIYIKPMGLVPNAQTWQLEPQLLSIATEQETVSSAEGAASRNASNAPGGSTAALGAATDQTTPGGPAGTAPSRPSRKSLAFTVPQLPRGAYLAWYEIPQSASPQQPIAINIIPVLIPQEGLINDLPRTEREIRIGIGSSYVLPRGALRPTRVSVPITLRSDSPTVANLTAGQSATVEVDAGGYATWRITINGPGQAEFIATAAGFEPTKVYVVGEAEAPSPEAEARFEAARLAQMRFSASEHEARRAQAQVAVLEMEHRAQSETAVQAGLLRDMLAYEEANSRLSTVERESTSAQPRSPVQQSRATAAAQPSAATSSARVGSTLPTALEATRAQLYEARSVARVAEGQNVAALDRLRTAYASLASVRPQPFALADLQPGDVLLTQGTTPFISDAIRFFEATQLGGAAPYSHASLYIGHINNRPMVAEMWLSGFWITPLEISIRGAAIVDVYRWRNGLSDQARSQIVQASRTLFGNSANCISERAPTSWSGSPCATYAAEQIGVLAGAAVRRLPAIALRGLASAADLLDGGNRRRMICSEFVAWAYQSAGLAPQATQWWPALEDAGILTSLIRKQDYTTPNTLARSESFRQVGRLKGGILTLL